LFRSLFLASVCYDSEESVECEVTASLNFGHLSALLRCVGDGELSVAVPYFNRIVPVLSGVGTK
jgi:hypothetical protein